jgi:hypothetical protein
METPDGKLTSKASAQGIIVPGRVPHKLTIPARTEKRASLGLILQESSKPITFLGHDTSWRPKGLCGPD